MTIRQSVRPDNELRERQRSYIRRAAHWAAWSPTELARAAGLAPSTINRLLNQDVAHVLSSKTLSALERALVDRLTHDGGRSAEEVRQLLRRMLVSSEAPLASVPWMPRSNLAVCGAVQAGAFSEAVEWPPDEQYPSPLAEDPRYGKYEQFALEVRGNSMDYLYPDKSFVACVLFMKLQRDPVVGEIVVTLRRDRHHDGFEATLKQLRQAPDGSYWLWPQSSDPSHRPVKLEGQNDNSDDNNDVVVWALVVGGYRAEPVRTRVSAVAA